MTRRTAAAFSAERLIRLTKTIREDIDRRLYAGAVIIVARDGDIAVSEAFGTVSADSSIRLELDSVFSIFSISKAFTNALVFRCIERGDFALTTRISDLLSDFSGGQREHITVLQLLTHRACLPPVLAPVAGMCIDRLDEVVASICANIQPTAAPGSFVCYSPMIAYALLGEAVRRADEKGRAFRDIANEEIFRRLGMVSTSFGVRKDLRHRHVVPTFPVMDPPFQHLGHKRNGQNGAFEEEDAEMPWVGAISTASDLFLFAEALRRGGEINGMRFVSSALLRRALQNHTGDAPNEIYRRIWALMNWEPWPAYLGLGFQLRGEALCPHHFGTLASTGTFGNTGFGSAVYWVDPDTAVTFVCLTAGVQNEAPSLRRFQRLADIVHGAVL